MNDTIRNLALENGRDVDLWPEPDQRAAARSIYDGTDGDIYLSEALDELTESEAECDALRAVLKESSAVAGEALLGKMAAKALFRYGIIQVESAVDECFDEWKRQDRLESAIDAAESAAEFRRDMQPAPLVRA